MGVGFKGLGFKGVGFKGLGFKVLGFRGQRSLVSLRSPRKALKFHLEAPASERAYPSVLMLNTDQVTYGSFLYECRTIFGT